MISVAFDLPKASTAAIASDGFFFAPFAGYFVFVRDYFMISVAFDLPKASTAAIASDGFFVCPQIGASSICSQTKKPPSYR